jgi:hypothetical protein
MSMARKTTVQRNVDERMGLLLQARLVLLSASGLTDHVANIPWMPKGAFPTSLPSVLSSSLLESSFKRNRFMVIGPIPIPIPMIERDRREVHKCGTNIPFALPVALEKSASLHENPASLCGGATRPFEATDLVLGLRILEQLRDTDFFQTLCVHRDTTR